MEIQHTLLQLGLSQIEADIYLAALSLDRPGATAIARRIGQQRTLVFFHLKKLVERGLMKESRKGRLVRFVPMAPDQLAAHYDALVAQLQSAIPELSKLKEIQEQTPTIEIRESRAGYKQIYEELSALPVGDFFCVIQGRESLDIELQTLTQDEWSRWFARINERQIGTRAVFTEEALTIAKQRMDSENLEQHKKRLWQIKTLPANILPFEQLIFLYRNRVAFLFPKTNLVTIIDHEGIARSFQALFSGLFALSKRIENPWD